MFVARNEYTKCITEILESCKRADIAVAFLGSGAEKLIGRASTGRIICNLESGATNPSVVRALRSNAAFEIKSSPALHAKAFISERAVLCGSANLSANGLGLEDQELAKWVEAGILSEDLSVIEAAQSWFDELWNSSPSISEAMLERAKKAWEKRRAVRPHFKGEIPDNRRGLFATIMEDWEFAKDRPLYIVLWQEDASDESSAAFERWREEEGHASSADDTYYENWPDFPVNAYLIDFYYEPKGGFEFTGLYFTKRNKITKRFDYANGEKGTLRIVEKEDNYDGLKVDGNELARFTRLIRPYIPSLLKAHNADTENPAICVRLHEALEQMGKEGLTPTVYPST